MHASSAKPEAARSDGSGGSTSGARATQRRSASERRGTAATRGSGASRPGTGVYIYGIVPADVELTSDTIGVGDPPGAVRLVRYGEIAALVSDVATDRPLGRPNDLMAHERLLDEAAAEVPVLPIRFGAVVTDTRAVVDELLMPHHDEFLVTLNDLEGQAEFVVKGRYVEQAVLRKVLEENPEIARLRDEIRDLPEEATWDTRMRIGELINASITARRETDTAALVDALTPLCVDIAVRDPTHEQDAAHLALLVRTDRQPDIEKALDVFGKRWEGLVGLRLLGPLAPYDFVRTQENG
ncbi:GvpL/GvpF family gas vesicle protein [Streptosporangium amethystogenes subsp. fukuiense]|uniref:GvpL/GvpF family gas vesicle protein n=1 Tax=Streptosporangium amethystogenes subsp. fukuiense TaxID=698418 RepID=A0ABW2SS25_9ACTN